MKMYLRFILLSFVIGTVFSGCALHQGYMANSAALSNKNFKYIKRDVKGFARATYILGIGGLSKSALVDAAKRKLLAENPLTDNQALVNLTVNWKNTFVPFVVINRCTVTADIVEFVE